MKTRIGTYKENRHAGLAPSAVGLYQFNIVVPQVPDSDSQINVSVGSIQVPQTVYLTVGQ